MQTRRHNRIRRRRHSTLSWAIGFVAVLLLVLFGYGAYLAQEIEPPIDVELYVSETMTEAGVELDAIVTMPPDSLDGTPYRVTWRYGANKEAPMALIDQHEGFSVYRSFVPVNLRELNADLFITYSVYDSTGTLARERVSPVALVLYAEGEGIAATGSASQVATASSAMVPDTSTATTQPVSTPPISNFVSTRPNPLRDIQKLYTARDSLVAKDAATLSANSEEGRLLREVADVPAGIWLTADRLKSPDYVRGHLTLAAQEGAVPILVVYTHPAVSCEQYNADPEGVRVEFLARIDTLARTIGEQRAIVVLEPDALSLKQCFYEPADKNMLADAVAMFNQYAPGATTYIDAGHAVWISSEDMAQRLLRSGIEEADGFALNVSNYIDTNRSLLYGLKLSDEVGGAHFVIDTSRNGNGPTDDYEWCNAPGRALGEPSTVVTRLPRVDGLLWVKPPGESDGSCNGGPREGTWWRDYALMLARNAR